MEENTPNKMPRRPTKIFGETVKKKTFLKKFD